MFYVDTYISSIINHLEDFWHSLITDTEASVVPATSTTTARPDTPTSTTEMPSNRRSMRGFGRSYVSEFGSSDSVTFNPLQSNPTQTAAPPHGASHNARSRRQQNATDHAHPQARRRREQAFPLGTREDVQQEDYVSPIFGMFNRAWTRYRDAEEVRAAARSTTSAQEAGRSHDGDYHLVDTHNNDGREVGFQSARQENIPPVDDQYHALAAQRHFDTSPLTLETMLQEGEAQMGSDLAHAALAAGVQRALSARRAYTDTNAASLRRDSPHPGVANVTPSTFGQNPTDQPMLRASRRGRNNFHTQFYSNPFNERPFRYHNGGEVVDLRNESPLDRVNPIDAQRSRRPAPAKSEDLKVNFACKICQEQKIDSICMPCMHATTCRWCAEIFKDECRDIDGRFDRRLWKCVMCRKQIHEVKRFYI